MSINIINLRAEIEKQSEKLITPKIAPLLNRKFLDAKEEMLEEFDNDPVTQELLEGPGLENSSFVDAHEGNLFSFLGFDAGDTPTEDLRNILEKQTTKGRVQKTVGDDVIKYKLEIRVPSLRDVEAETKNLSWTTRSWVAAIQKGIGGLPSYIFKALGFKNSRSGTALQAKNQVRDGSFRPVNYISKILNNFRKNMRDN